MKAQSNSNEPAGWDHWCSLEPEEAWPSILGSNQEMWGKSDYLLQNCPCRGSHCDDLEPTGSVLSEAHIPLLTVSCWLFSYPRLMNTSMTMKDQHRGLCLSVSRLPEFPHCLKVETKAPRVGAKAENNKRKRVQTRIGLSAVPLQAASWWWREKLATWTKRSPLACSLHCPAECITCTWNASIPTVCTIAHIWNYRLENQPVILFSHQMFQLRFFL